MKILQNKPAKRNKAWHGLEQFNMVFMAGYGTALSDLTGYYGKKHTASKPATSTQ